MNHETVIWNVNGRTREMLEVTGYTSVDGDLIVHGFFADETGTHHRSVIAAALEVTA